MYPISQISKYATVPVRPPNPLLVRLLWSLGKILGLRIIICSGCCCPYSTCTTSPVRLGVNASFSVTARRDLVNCSTGRTSALYVYCCVIIYRHSSSVNLGRRHFCPKIMNEKLTKCPNFYDICPEKNNKTPEFYMISARKMPGFYTRVARKIFFPNCGARSPRLRYLRPVVGSLRRAVFAGCTV